MTLDSIYCVMYYMCFLQITLVTFQHIQTSELYIKIT